MSATSYFLFCALALVVGSLIPVLGVANAALGRALGGVSVASVVLFATGLLVVSLIALFARASVPAASAFAQAPRYGYVGGLIMASYVLMITALAPRLGIGTAIAFVVTGQIFSAALIDHYGLFGSATVLVTTRRLVGMGFMVLGVFLAKKSSL